MKKVEDWIKVYIDDFNKGLYAQGIEPSNFFSGNKFISLEPNDYRELKQKIEQQSKQIKDLENKILILTIKLKNCTNNRTVTIPFL